jgi:SSU ribosomal protein S6P
MSSKHYRAQRMYESVVVFKPTLTEDEYNTKLNEVKDFIAKKGGNIVHEEDWGTKNLAYKINGFGHGRYHFFKIFSTNPQLPNDLDFYYKINEDVIRWLNILSKETNEEKVSQ